MELQVGDPSHIGPFRLIGLLGEGGMGRVYLGISPGGRRVAIKVVHPRHASDPDFRRRFAREVDAARRVGGFHTAGVVDADPGADPPWMATAYIPGPSLAHAIVTDGPLSEGKVRELGAALAEGLAAIHACDLVHRDLKPSNIIVADDGPRIIDFGITKVLDGTSLTHTDAIIGTFDYMAPETLRRQKLTPKCDIFALGGALTYAATGHVPFGAEDLPAIIARILTEEPDLTPLTGDLRDIISACLDKNPDARPGTADILARLNPPDAGSNPGPHGGTPPDGTTHTADVPQWHTDPPPARPDGTSIPDRTGRRRQRTLIGAGTAVVVAAGAISAVLLNSPSPHKGSAANSHSVTSSTATGSARPSASAGTTQTPGTRTVPLETFKIPTDQGAEYMTFGPDDSLAVAGGNGTSYVWDAATRKVIETLAGPEAGKFGDTQIAFGPDHTVAVGDTGSSAHLWNTTTNKITETLTDPDDSSAKMGAVAFTPGGTLVVSDSDGRTYFWDTSTNKPTATFTDPDTDGICNIEFGPDNTLIAGDYNGNIYIWNISTGKFIVTLKNPVIPNSPNDNSLDSIALGPDNTLAAADSNGHVYIWNTVTHKMTATYTDPGNPNDGDLVSDAAFGPDDTLAATDNSGNTYLWSTKTGKLIATLKDPKADGSPSVAFGPGDILATGDPNNNIDLWNIKSLL